MTEQPTNEPAAEPAAPQPQAAGEKSFVVALILSILLGEFGIDRFYLGYIGLGVLKLVTFGGCGVWQLIDIILIATDKLNDADGNPLQH